MSVPPDKVQDTARLHEKTVQDIAKGKVPTMGSKPRRASRSAPVTSIKPHPLVWETAKAIIADPSNGYTKAEIISETEMRVS